jgi:hypothetical protein
MEKAVAEDCLWFNLVFKIQPGLRVSPGSAVRLTICQSKRSQAGEDFLLQTSLNFHYGIQPFRWLFTIADVAESKAERCVVGVNSGFDVLGSPAAHILEEANAANGSVIAKIEPVLRAAGYIHQVT